LSTLCSNGIISALIATIKFSIKTVFLNESKIRKHFPYCNSQRTLYSGSKYIQVLLDNSRPQSNTFEKCKKHYTFSNFYRLNAMSNRSFDSVVYEAHLGIDDFLVKMLSIPRNTFGEIEQMQGNLEELLHVYFGPTFRKDNNLSSNELRKCVICCF
jgi:hypothetical protein